MTIHKPASKADLQIYESIAANYLKSLNADIDSIESLMKEINERIRMKDDTDIEPREEVMEAFKRSLIEHDELYKKLAEYERKEKNNSLSEPRIVCAAIRSRKGHIITSARHYDTNMHRLISLMKDPEDFHHMYADNQGFVDQHGNYYTREEAWEIAEKNGQIIRDIPASKGKLYSENLY